MAALPSIKQILAESFPKLPWMPQLLAPLNQFMSEVVRALNNQLTVNENMDGVVQTVTVDGVYPVKFKWPRKSAPKVAWIGYCREIGGNHTNFAAAIFLDWEYTGDGEFKINAIPGLAAAAADKYYVTIIALAG